MADKEELIEQIEKTLNKKSGDGKLWIAYYCLVFLLLVFTLSSNPDLEAASALWMLGGLYVSTVTLAVSLKLINKKEGQDA